MTSSDFNRTVENQLNYCKELLGVKSQEYSPDGDDRLHSFTVAAQLLGCSRKEALAGMMVKHTVSIYDMCREGEHTPEKWEEKITDSINYLLLLRGILEEEFNDGV